MLNRRMPNGTYWWCERGEKISPTRLLGSEKQWQAGSRAKIKKFDFVVDVFTPTYGTDCEDTIIAGYDVRHGAIGPGTLATHGYERTHKNAVKNTYILLKSYIVK